MSKILRVGLAGLGTVGAAVLDIIEKNASNISLQCDCDVKITAISARSKNKDRGFDLSPYQWFDHADDLAKSDVIDVYIELIGGESGIAESSVKAALSSGKHVITANKALMAYKGVELARLAEKHNVSLYYEAAVAGGIPIIRTMRDSLVGNNVSRVSGILNGTCNYILTRMENEEISFDACLKDAQALGYAEADPTFDIDGFDTAHKLALLTSLAFGTHIDLDAVYVEGIREIALTDVKAADDLGYRIKLLGVSERTESGIEQRVHPTMVPKNSEIGQISGVTNAVAVYGDRVGSIVLAGPGAGGDATATSVLGDLGECARGIKPLSLGRSTHNLEAYKKARMRAHEGGYYVRLSLYDKSGAFASIATIMAKHNISLEQIVQKNQPHSVNGLSAQDQDALSAVPVILITHQTLESDIRTALKEIEEGGHLDGSPQLIRIER